MCIDGSVGDALYHVLGQIRKHKNVPEKDQIPVDLLVPESTAAMLIAIRGAIMIAMKSRSEPWKRRVRG